MDEPIHSVKIQTNELHSFILWLKLFDRPPLSIVSGSATGHMGVLG
jgi:hypothetical protein